MFTLILALTSTVATITQTHASTPQSTPTGQPASFLWGDWDGDGVADAFILTPSGEAHLMRNRRDGSFEDVTARAGLAELGEVTAAGWGDYDADGRIDLFVGRAHAPDRLYRNAGRGVLELSEIALVHDGVARAAHWQDYDQDGLVDLHVHTDEDDILYHNSGATIFERVELPPLERSAAPAISTRVDGQDELATGDGDSSRAQRSARGDADARAASRSGGSASASTSGAATAAPGGTHNPAPPPSCAGAPSVQDQSSSSCILASSTPSLGLLYPLSVNLNVDSSGRVGMGTTTPLYKLHVIDAANTGVFGQGGTHGVRGDANLAGTGNRYGGYFTSSGGSNNIGVYGASTIGLFGTGSGYGAYGESNASNGVGVYGKANHASGVTIGVLGESVSSNGVAIEGRATATTGSTAGVRGTASSLGGAGVEGINSSATGNTTGVRGTSVASPNGTGVYGTGRVEGVHGLATATSGNAYGVYGETAAGTGVAGSHTAVTGSGNGVSGHSASTAGTGVLGTVSATSGTTYGVRGITSSNSALAAGVRGDAVGSGAGVTGQLTSGDGAGVLGKTGSQDAAGVRGENAHAFTSASTNFAAGILGSANGGMGVLGLTHRSSALQNGSSGVVGSFNALGEVVLLPNSGVSGSTDEDTGAGVFGYAKGGVGVLGQHGSTSGTEPGVRGETSSTVHHAVALEGRTTDSVAADRIAVRGIATPQPYFGFGGWFEGGYVGVVGLGHGAGTGERLGGSFDASGGTSLNFGVQTTASGVSAIGIVAGATGSSSIGGDFYASGTDAIGGYFNAGGTGSRAGFFDGNTHVNGTLSKSGGSFKIDHPLDPEHKTLSHSFVESPDMMNIYNGNAALDARGEAWVEMPDWFDALNRDFRYQLTPIGAPAPMLYVAVPMANRRFQIAGGAPNGQVSWQVTGVRQDPWAEMNRIPVEEWKRPDEQGLYYNPQSYGVAEERGIGYALRKRKGGDRARIEAAEKVLHERDASAAASRTTATHVPAGDRSAEVREGPASRAETAEPRTGDE